MRIEFNNTLVESSAKSIDVINLDMMISCNVHVSTAASIAMERIQWPIAISYDSKEGYIPLLKLFGCISAKGCPDEVYLSGCFCYIQAPYLI